ncbi:MAG: hypothetical protein A3J74_04890 [Elusimicrobia bacterium RIFCSPHIGHO2_02_FULL_57_9]|nr:MAG: hypothetical protein A3J74_04890 [Elusimicrobia bacterium RIFCSPHIGHO2_02_FULL_57_9]
MGDLRAKRLRYAVFLAAWLAVPCGHAQLHSKELELKRVQKELEKTRREIEDYKKLEQGLDGELQKIQTRNETARGKLIRLQRSIRVAEKKKNELKSQLGSLGLASGFWRTEVEDELRGYTAAWASRNESFGSGDLWVEAYRRGAILEKARLLGSLQGLGHKTELAQARTQIQTQQLLDKTLQAELEEQNRRQEYKEKKAAKAQTQEKVAAAMQRAGELEQSAQALTSLIRRLNRPQPGKAGRLAPWEVGRNSLAWPAAGSVVKAFGRQRNLELDAWVINQGILIETRPGAPVMAVEKGRVIFSGPFKSYGQVMILDHGENFYSVYGELGQLLKSKGQKVRIGEPIANTGSGDRATLYLELRHGAEALDPLIWLKKK